MGWVKTRIERVQRKLAGKVICNHCGATLETYSEVCSVDLAVRCEGFETIEAADASQELEDGPR